jgi:hypothetical protein
MSRFIFSIMAGLTLILLSFGTEMLLYYFYSNMSVSAEIHSTFLILMYYSFNYLIGLKVRISFKQ